MYARTTAHLSVEKVFPFIKLLDSSRSTFCKSDKRTNNIDCKKRGPTSAFCLYYSILRMDDLKTQEWCNHGSHSIPLRCCTKLEHY